MKKSQKTKGISTYKAIQDLSKKTSKDRAVCGREQLQGAYFYENVTMICNGYYALILNDNISGLVMAKQNENTVDLRRVLPKKNEELVELEYNLNNIKNIIKIKTANRETPSVEFGDLLINAKYFVMIASCLENCKIYQVKDKLLSPLVLIGDNGKGMILPMRKN